MRQTLTIKRSAIKAAALATALTLPAAAQAQTGSVPGGYLPGVAASLATTVTAIKASPGWLGKMLCNNPNPSVAYVQVFNIAAGAVTLGSSLPVDIVPVPPNSLNGGFALPFPGERFSTAISLAATTTPTGSTAPASALTCAYGYN
jgi:hypothetical protein